MMKDRLTEQIMRKLRALRNDALQNCKSSRGVCVASSLNISKLLNREAFSGQALNMVLFQT